MTSVADGAADSLALTGNPATIQCGGFDDNQQVVETSKIEVIHLVADATIRVFPLPTVSSAPYQTLRPQQLAAYIRHDKDTRVFEVTGPASAVTAITEVYHP